jgi:G:T-mismatch repair DNA endonuclease (very short patch repair protein)
VAVRKHWLAKLNGNAARDKLHQVALRQLTPGIG